MIKLSCPIAAHCWRSASHLLARTFSSIYKTAAPDHFNWNEIFVFVLIGLGNVKDLNAVGNI